MPIAICYITLKLIDEKKTVLGNASGYGAWEIPGWDLPVKFWGLGFYNML